MDEQLLTGPFVTVAAVCERVLIETDNTASLIRVVDALMVTPNSGPVPTNLFWIVTLKSGGFRGTASVRGCARVGEKVDEVFSAKFDFTGEAEQGVNFVVNVQSVRPEDHTVFFDTYVNERHFTTTPFRIRLRQEK